MEAAQQIPFYLDWSFWTVVAAFLALVLSQLPPVYFWFRAAKLELEVFSHIHLTHKVGNPNAKLHLILSNVGGREVKINKIYLHFSREDEKFSLPAQGFFQEQGDKNTLLFTRFKIKPKEDWAHIACFFKFFSRTEEKKYRQIESNLKTDIQSKLNNKTEEQRLVVARDDLIQPIMDFFEGKFRWEPGEYDFKIEIAAFPQAASLSKKYRLTLFESDSSGLRAYAESYKYGAGIYFETEHQPGIFISISEA